MTGRGRTSEGCPYLTHAFVFIGGFMADSCGRYTVSPLVCALSPAPVSLSQSNGADSVRDVCILCISYLSCEFAVRQAFEQAAHHSSFL